MQDIDNTNDEDIDKDIDKEDDDLHGNDDNEENSDGLITVKEGGKEYLMSRLKGGDLFTGKMFLRNEIDSVLKAFPREFNAETFVYYDISGKIRFSDMFTGENDIMDREDIDRLCRSFEKLTEDIREYLLDMEEVCVSPDSIFYVPEKKCYEFLYIPGKEAKDCFNEGVRMMWERVMEKFNHQSDMDTIARVYDIYQKVSMQSFDPEEVFGSLRKNKTDREYGKEHRKKTGGVNETNDQKIPFSKEFFREAVSEAENSVSGRINVRTFSEPEDTKEDILSDERKKQANIFDGLKMKLAGSAGFFSGIRTDKEKKIEDISKSMEEEAKIGFKIKNYLAMNSANIFKVLMCVSVLFLILAIMPSSVVFKPPVSASVGMFLVCLAVAVYAKKLGKDIDRDGTKETCK